MVRAIVIAALMASACVGQTFEVASIKPSAPANGGPFRVGSSGGPGSRDPGLFTCQNCSLSNLITGAYNLKRYQLPGASGLDSERFNVTAKVPEGTTKEQFRLMQQNLLSERFGLKVHYEKKEMQQYELVVGKNGPKLKESAEAPASGSLPPGPPKRDKDGFPILPAGARGTFGSVMNGRARMDLVKETMEQLVGLLSNQLGKPVTDATGLKGRYDFSLTWALDMGSIGRGGPMPPSPEGGPPPLASLPEGESGPTLVGAVQEQLGLRLEQKKGLVDILVIDHIEKVPTEN